MYGVEVDRRIKVFVKNFYNVGYDLIRLQVGYVVGYVFNSAFFAVATYKRQQNKFDAVFYELFASRGRLFAFSHFCKINLIKLI